MPNVEVLQDLMDHITTHRDEHDQSNWFRRPMSEARISERARPGYETVGMHCGTAACAAGHLVARNGYAFLLSDGHTATATVIKKEDIGGEIGTRVARKPTLKDRSIRLAAMEIADFTEDEADDFFASGNSLFELWAMAWVWTTGRIQLPDSLPEGSTRDYLWWAALFGGDASWWNRDDCSVTNTYRAVLDWCHENDHRVGDDITGDILEVLSDKADERDRALQAAS